MAEDSTGERLARIETRLDIVLQRLDPMINDHESRLRRMERWLWMMAGTALAGGGAAGAMVSALVDKAAGH